MTFPVNSSTLVDNLSSEIDLDQVKVRLSEAT